MTVHPWPRLRQVLELLDRCLWQPQAPEAPSLARVIMTFKHTRPLTSSATAAPIPAPANDLE